LTFDTNGETIVAVERVAAWAAESPLFLALLAHLFFLF
jgi:hypothetical protein